jgi:hypothetical protein
MKPVHPFIKKEHPEIPDSYGLKILYLDGTSEEASIAHHKILSGLGVFEYVTTDDLWNLIPISSIKKVSFDKNFSKLMALKSQVKTPEQPKKEGV